MPVSITREPVISTFAMAMILCLNKTALSLWHGRCSVKSVGSAGELLPNSRAQTTTIRPAECVHVDGWMRGWNGFIVPSMLQRYWAINHEQNEFVAVQSRDAITSTWCGNFNWHLHCCKQVIEILHILKQMNKSWEQFDQFIAVELLEFVHNLCRKFVSSQVFSYQRLILCSNAYQNEIPYI